MPEIGEVKNSPGSTLTLNDLRALDEEVERQIMPAFIKLSEDESRPLIPVAHVPLRLLGDEAERAVSLIDGSIQYHVLDVYGSAGINPDFSGYERHRLLRSRLERRIRMGSPETNGVIPTLTIAPGSDSGSVNVQKTRVASVERVGISEFLAEYPADWLSAFSEATGVEFEGTDRFDFAVNVVADKYSQWALRDLDSAGAKLIKDPAGNQRIRKPLSEFADLYNQALLTEYTERRIEGVLRFAYPGLAAEVVSVIRKTSDLIDGQIDGYDRADFTEILSYWSNPSDIAIRAMMLVHPKIMAGVEDIKNNNDRKSLAEELIVSACQKISRENQNITQGHKATNQDLYRNVLQGRALVGSRKQKNPRRR